MSSAGHVIDMNNRMKQNAALKGLRRKRFQKVKEMYLIELEHFNIKNNLTKQHVSKEELAQIKLKIRQKIKTQRKKSFQLSLITSIVIILTLFYLLYSRS